MVFDGPIAIDEASPLGRVDVALDEHGNAWVSWLTAADSEGGARLRVARVGRRGALQGPFDVARVASSRNSGVPQMVLAGSRLVLAWTEPGAEGGVRTAALRIGARERH